MNACYILFGGTFLSFYNLVCLAMSSFLFILQIFFLDMHAKKFCAYLNVFIASADLCEI